MRPVRILCVCGSGTATSAMLAAKLQDVLEEHGYQLDSDETNPPGVPIAMMTNDWDLIAFTSPIEDDPGIPMLNATGFLVGINEDEFIEQLMDEVGKLDLSE
ncbi:PTS fructose transporter subunit IIB [Olsenella sp. AF16-14LB]|jgi:PTS system galactitol-specific IIB component|uniref:PTS fructose transporter subunit IIB n=1 Tax=Tractidigestivibacter montrealensis TaxID=2972466 RepID=A0ABT1Z8R2_9ACTN|nr:MULTISPECIES: PTS fructose transporter subunit IIB [Atopobiaceae]MCR9036592.1 PTS fructose transporter subunit IIB [Tractidigestivibacter montrealensis]RGJ45859.1 PTS fructose transporter subunit IIB [Olsenella sp. TM06-36]RGS49797.1 PTS fructose transporter subunit IIB [Olsenella sp. AF21-51]RGU52014.1 PTS fructose transporter subunit IIB [Olsenella sp. AF16-14LB]RGU83404.1 PTS fructose transporter subunit IIB [Olsenella sp. AF15-43LB]